LNPRQQCHICDGDRFQVCEINWLQCQDCGSRREIDPTWRKTKPRPETEFDKAFDAWNQSVIDNIGRPNPGDNACDKRRRFLPSA